MCSVDIPETPEIAPLIQIDPNASKPAHVKTAAGTKSADANKTTGVQDLTATNSKKQSVGFFDQLSSLFSGGSSALQIPQQ